MIERESPIELRKALAIVEALKTSGIGFVPVAITSEEERLSLASLCLRNLDKIAKMAEE